MNFYIVQTRKSKTAKPVLTIVPSKWVSSDSVYWPPTNFVALSTKSNSEPDRDKWHKQKCKLVGRANTYKSAEEIVRKLENVTDSEDAVQTSRGTRAQPAKRNKKFQSKTYKLDTEVYEISTEQTSFKRKDIESKSAVSLKEVENKNPFQATVTAARDGLHSTTEKHNFTNESGIVDIDPVQSADGKHYIKLQNGRYVEVISEYLNPDPAINRSDISSDLQDKQITLPQELDQRLQRIETWLQKIISFMADISKFIEIRGESAAAAPAPKRRKEDFEEFETLLPIKDEEKLRFIENNLNDQIYFEKFSRFVSSQYALNGKRDGKAFFRILIRKMIVPNVLIPYSWKGNSRSCNIQGVGENKGFKKYFPNIVKFFESVTCEADYAFTTEAVHEAFSNFLRQKHTEMKRFLVGGERNIPSSRVRCNMHSMEIEQKENTGNSTGDEDLEANVNCFIDDIIISYE